MSPAAAPPASAPPEISPAALIQQKQGAAVMIWAIGAFCIFGWEWLLCLPQEYRRIWKKPLNSSSILYIANRYFGIIQLSFVMTLQASVWSPSVCKHVYLWEPVGALISTFLSQLILGSRVYAIFAQNKTIAFVLGCILAVEIAIAGMSISVTSPPPPFAGPAGLGPPCSAVIGPFGWLVAFWAIPLLYDTITFLLTAWKAYGFWKREVDTPLFKIIWRDGLLYFFAIFSMNVANVIIFLAAPKTLRPVNLTPTLVLEIVLSCRLILNLRSAGKSSISKGPLIVPWSDNSKTHTSNLLTGIEPEYQSRSTEPASMHGTATKLEPTGLARIPADIQAASQTVHIN